MNNRFKVYIDSNNLKSLWDDDGDGEPLLFLDREDNIQGVDEVCDLLNEQHEQIEQLKRNFKSLDEVKCEIAEEKRFRVEKQTFDGYCIVDNDFDEYYAYEKQDLEKLCENLNDLSDENEQLKSENETYKNMFFEIVETALTDKNCRELYCKGVLDIFDKANSLNQARDMIKGFLE